MFELIYTSAPKGILPGRTGFSTVAFTAGMPPNRLTPLENLSGYEFTFQGSVLPEALNPAVCSFVHLHYGSNTLRVASRIAPNGLDYTMRNNKIAHHLLFEFDAELDNLPSGAAGLFGIPGNFEEDFSGAPHELPVRHVRACAAPAEPPAEAWKKFTGDAGNAGAIAERFLHQPEKPFYVEYPQTVTTAEKLQLLLEVTELLPSERRKDFTFSTYFTRERPGEDCFLRMIPEFSPLLGTLKRFHPEQILTLGAPCAIPAAFAASELVKLARCGHEIPEPPPAPPIQLASKPELILPPQPPGEKPQGNRRGKDSVKIAPKTPERPRSVITRTYVEEETRRNWRPWAIAVAVALIAVLVLLFAWMSWNSDTDGGAPVTGTSTEPSEQTDSTAKKSAAQSSDVPPVETPPKKTLPEFPPEKQEESINSPNPPVALAQISAGNPEKKAPDATSQGHFIVEDKGIVYRCGQAGSSCRIGKKELHDGEVILARNIIKKYNASVDKYDNALDTYFKKTGNGEPYTAESFQKKLDQLFADVPMEQLEDELQKLIDEAPFGRCKKKHFSVEEMQEAINRKIAEAEKAAEKQKKNSTDADKKSHYQKIFQDLKWEKAIEREKNATDAKKRKEIKLDLNTLNNSAFNDMQVTITKLQLSPKLLDDFFAPLNVETKEGGKRKVKTWEAPNQLTDEMLKDFCEKLDKMIECKPENEAAQ